MRKDNISFGISFLVHLCLIVLCWQSSGQEKKKPPFRIPSIQVRYVEATDVVYPKEAAPKVRELKVKTASNENKKQKQKEIYSKRKEVLQKISKTLTKPAAVKAPLKPSVQNKGSFQQKIMKEIKETKEIAEKKGQVALSFEEKIIDLFAQSLCLPRVGRVWLILYFDEKGSFVKMEEMDYESRDNLVYLQQMLPRLCYPPNPTEKEQRYEICFDGSSID